MQSTGLAAPVAKADTDLDGEERKKKPVRRVEVVGLAALALTFYYQGCTAI